MNTKPTDQICSKCGAAIPGDAPRGLCPRCVLSGAAIDTDAGRQRGGRIEPPPLAAIAAAFPQLEIIELLGVGGMGVVYKARQPKLDRFVALKVLPTPPGADPAFAERFQREARFLARLNHKNIVSVFDFGESGGFCFLVLEYVDGVNLRQAMRAGRFSPGEALAIVPCICGALQYAHEQGVLHRDIKPENILLDARGNVKIADFGIAKLTGEPGGDRADATLTQSGARLGTPHYMAPEQIENPSEVDHRADIYSLGVVFYELLTGELPLGRFAPPSEKINLDARIDAIVLRALTKERELRQQSAGELGTQVEGLRTRSTAKEGQPAVARSHWPKRVSWLVLLKTQVPGGFTILAVAMLALLLVAWLFLRKISSPVDLFPFRPVIVSPSRDTQTAIAEAGGLPQQLPAGTPSAAALKWHFAWERLEQSRQRTANGVASGEELLAAQRDLAVAEAEFRHNPVAAADANVTYAEAILEITRKRFDVGIVSRSEVNDATLALAQAREARQKIPTGPGNSAAPLK